MSDWNDRQNAIRLLKAQCGRCNAPIGDGWENGWPLHGLIDIGFPAQAFAFLRGRDYIAEASDFEWWKSGHPALKTNEAQRICFKWDDESEWRLCYTCQKELLHTLGLFFGISVTKAAPEKAKS